MSKFRYVAYDNHGRKQSGYVDAETRDVAILQIKNKGLQPTVVHGPYGAGGGAGRFSISRVRVKALSAYTRKFAQLYKAGLGIDEIFDLLGEEEDVSRLRVVSKKLAEDIRSGVPLDSALRKYPMIFPPLFVALFNVGIESGNLDDISDRLATMYEKESSLRIQMMGKLVYPIAMLAIGFFAAYLLSHFGAIPESVFINILTFWVIVIAIIIFFCTPLGYPILRSILRYVPYIGPLMLKTNMSRFCRIMGILYGSGIPLLESLDLSEQTLQDPRLSNSIRQVKAMVNKGEDLSTAMKRSGMIPARVISMVAVGERGGDVEAVLTKMSAYYDIEIEHHHNVLMVVSYFVAYMMMAMTIGYIILSFWMGYYGNINALMS